MIEIPNDRLADVNGGWLRNTFYSGMVAASMLTGGGAAAGKMHNEDVILPINPAPMAQMIGQR
jgi:hypothetical protein